jgi:hypothetical protein
MTWRPELRLQTGGQSVFSDTSCAQALGPAPVVLFTARIGSLLQGGQ